MEFSNQMLAAEPFKEVIDGHNANRQKLIDARTYFNGKAARLTEILFSSYNIGAGAPCDWEVETEATQEGTRTPGTTPDRTAIQPRTTRRPGCSTAPRGTRANVQSIFADPLGGGNANCYDPWDGRWAGCWTNISRSSDQVCQTLYTNYHIWDETRLISGQHIQPVTQRRFLDNETAATATPTYIGAGEIGAAWTAGKVDVAINVYSRDEGLTGWVVKKTDGLVAPHIAFLLNPHTLIWITTFVPRAGGGSHSQVINWDDRNEFYMFFEWVSSDRQRYGITGGLVRRSDLEAAQAPRIPVSGFTTGYVKDRARATCGPRQCFAVPAH